MIKNVLAKIPRHVILGLLFFAAMSCVTIFLFRGGVNSPDEAANLLFIRSWRESAALSVPIAVQQPAAYPLFPRSTVPHDQLIVPAGFVGLPVLFGSLSIAFGEWSVFYLTVVFTMIAAVGWWYLTRQIFGRAIADVSFWLFLFHPAVIYYSARGLFPNMLMMNFVVVAVAAAWYAYMSRSRMMWIFAVSAALLACAVRAPDALGMFALVCVAAAVWGDRSLRRLSLRVLGGLIACAALALVARGFGWLPGSYSFVELNSVASVLFPFGVNIARVWQTTIAFIVKLFSPWVLISTAGLLWWFWHVYKTRTFDKTIAAYLAVVIPASFWLFVMYGSWAFADNLANPNAVTLGSSYIRYWLPHLLFRMPFAAVLLFVCIEHWKLPVQKFVRGFVMAIVVLGVWRAYAGVDGLKWMIAEVNNSRTVAVEVIKRVPQSAVVAVRVWDKFIFPGRAVLQPFPRDVRTFGAVRELLDRGTPVYAFIETLKETDQLWLRDNKVAVDVVAVYGIHTLYQLSVWNSGR